MKDPLKDDSIPRYRLLSPCPIDDTLYEEGEIIAFTGTPNEEMEPLNKKAEEELDKYREYLDHHAAKYAEKMGRHFEGRKEREDQISENLADARVVSMTRSQVPQRPDLVPEAKRRGRPRKVLASKPVEKPGKPGPQAIKVLGGAYGSSSDQGA